jgi:hypothetical protein
MANFLLNDIELESFCSRYGRPVPSFAFDLPFCVHVDERIWEINSKGLIAICRLIIVFPENPRRGEGQGKNVELKDDPYGTFRYSRIEVALRSLDIQLIFKENRKGDPQELYAILKRFPCAKSLPVANQVRNKLGEGPLVMREGTNSETVASDIRRNLSRITDIEKRHATLIPTVIEIARPDALRAVNRFVEVFRWKAHEWHLPYVSQLDLTQRFDRLWFSSSYYQGQLGVFFPGGLTLAQQPVSNDISIRIEKGLLAEDSPPFELDLLWSARRHERVGHFRSAFLDAWASAEYCIYVWSRNLLLSKMVPPNLVEEILKGRFEDSLRDGVKERAGTSFALNFHDEWTLLLKLKDKRDDLMHGKLTNVDEKDSNEMIRLAEWMVQLINK